MDINKDGKRKRGDKVKMKHNTSNPKGAPQGFYMISGIMT